jgi:ribosomal protein S18 acetylase RimI-like enzyme
MSNRYSLSYSPNLSARLGQLAHGFVPGFVWEEDGSIIGNATLLQSDIPNRYLVANVAVHPDYRRRGIAKGLMEEIINYVATIKGRRIMLQVDSSNESAVTLYNSLSFDDLGIMNRWDALPGRLRPLSSERFAGVAVRSLQRREWKEAYELDIRSIDPDLTWPAPPAPDQYKFDIWRRLGDFFNGRNIEGWVCQRRTPSSGKNFLAGMAVVTNDWGRPSWLRLRVHPEFQGQLEGALMAKSLDRLRRQRRATIRISHPAADQITNALLEEANFRLERSLTVMSLDLTANRQ